MANAAVVPDGSGRQSAPTLLVTGSRPQRFLATTHACAIRDARISWVGACRDRMALKQAGSRRAARRVRAKANFPVRDTAAAGRHDRRASGSARRYI
jgi:hypothetical protein